MAPTNGQYGYHTLRTSLTAVTLYQIVGEGEPRRTESRPKSTAELRDAALGGVGAYR